MNFSLPGGTLTLISTSDLDKIMRYQECIANFACEISGRDAVQCISAISPMTHELETRSDGSFRIHKPTEPQARLIQMLAQNWVASAPGSREVTAFPVSTDHSAQQAKDASNLELTGNSAGSFRSGLAITGGPWNVEVELDEKGAVSKVVLSSGSVALTKVVPPEVPAPEPESGSEKEAPPEAITMASNPGASTEKDKNKVTLRSSTKTPRKGADPTRKPSNTRKRPGKAKK
jgi:hypothetical protein